MTAKTTPARRAAFFRALAETGNQTLAAERAKVSRSWVSGHRAADPAFRAELISATATAKARLKAAGGVGPATRWGSTGGEELVVRGTSGRRTQIARARMRQWTPRVEARFLTALSASCNVKAACAAVGLSQESAYKHRQRWPDFDRRWHEALVTGYDRLNEALLDSGGRLFGTVEHDPDAPLPVMTVEEALALMRLHQFAARGVGRSPGRVPRITLPSAESVDAALAARLDRHDARKAAAAARKARRAAG